MEEVRGILNKTDERMKKVIEALREHLKSIRTGRANAALLDGIMVSYYGVDTPIAQVGSISAPDAQMLLVQPWDKTALKEIEKAILASDRGLNPNNDGSVIRIPIPALTEERRRDLVKQVKKTGEEFKIQIRNVRRDSNDDLKKLEKGTVPEDVISDAMDDIQGKTDSAIRDIDGILKNKESAIMEI